LRQRRRRKGYLVKENYSGADHFGTDKRRGGSRRC
jgi:hypothetical protein